MKKIRKRVVKKERYLEQLDEAIINVEFVLNRINKLSNDNQVAKEVVTHDLLVEQANLELELAILAILLRKLRENMYITMDQDIRYATNAIIHSNRFSYQKGVVVVYSRRGEERIILTKLLDYSKQIAMKLGGKNEKINN